MEKYKCEICGKQHQVYGGITVPAPRIVLGMSEEEEEKRVKKVGALCVIDGELLFIHGYVNIELEHHEFPFFYWKVWVAISRKKFSDSLEVLKTGKVVELEGKLENDLPFYPKPEILDSKVLIRAANSEEALIVEIIATEESKLKEDQSKPITKERVIEIMQMLHHNPGRKN